MKFDMGSDTLVQLAKETLASNDDLGGLVKELVDCVTPLEGNFIGAGRQRFDQFKANVDQIAADLNASLASINSGQVGMEQAFGQGDQELADNSSSTDSAANYDAARFASARA